MGHSLPVSDGTPEARERAAQHLRRQAELTASALYAAILVAASDDAAAGGPCWQVLQGHERDPFSTALALKFLGGVHRLVLEGKAPELAPFYPSVGGDANRGDPFPAFVTTVQQHIGELQKSLDLGVQTNEVGRSAALLPGFLAVANRWGLPLRIRELGTSAGLNLRWDHFRYDRNGRGWGDPSSVVRFGDDVFETDAPFDIGATVVDRRGCDRAPLDATTDEGRMRLMSYVWPDQPELSTCWRTPSTSPAASPPPSTRQTPSSGPAPSWSMPSRVRPRSCSTRSSSSTSSPPTAPRWKG